MNSNSKLIGNLSCATRHWWAAGMLALTLLLSCGTNRSNAQTKSDENSPVFGVFVGSTPSSEEVRMLLEIPGEAVSPILWTTSIVHSSLHRPGLEGAREGIWSIIQGTETNPKAIIYRLAATKSEAALFLLKGDDNVLFFVDEKQQLLTGTADFSYTLNGKKS